MAMASSTRMAKRRDRSPAASGFHESNRNRICIRSGADSEFEVELEEPVLGIYAPWNSGQSESLPAYHPLLPDHNSFYGSRSPGAPFSLTDCLGHLEPDSPPSGFDFGQLDHGRSERLAFSHAGFGRSFRRHSAVDHVNAPVSPDSTQDSTATDLGHHGCAGCSNPICSQTRSQSLPIFQPSSYLGSPLLQNLHSLSESALQSSPSYWMPISHGDSVNGSVADHGGFYDSSQRSGSGIFVSPGSLLPRSTSPSLAATTAAISAFSQVRAQIESFRNTKNFIQMNPPEEKRAPIAILDSLSSGLSASALISRVVAPGITASGITIPGSQLQASSGSGDLVSSGTSNSTTSSVGMSFSKLTSAASCAANSGSGHQNSDGGLKLVQLLVSCAEAVACRDSRQASSLLRTLRTITSPHGDAMQRVSACFVEGLSIRIYSSPTGFKTSSTSSVVPITSSCRIKPGPSDQERQEALSLLCQSCPYIGFGHYTANTAILDAFVGEDRLHIIDLGMSQGLQWPSLFYSLASRVGGKPKSVRITAVGLGVTNLAHTSDQLYQAALEAGIALSFKCIPESVENIREFKLDLRAGEALAVNSVLQLHCVVKESRGSLNTVLQSIRKLNPKVLTLVEQDASHNGPFFMGRFVEALHYYSAVFDSLEAILPRYSTQRVKIEQFHFAEEIRNIVSCEGPARVERHERIDQWRRRMSRAGFQPFPLKFVNETRQWLANYHCAGYTLAEEKGCLVLGWNGKPIIAASCWRC